MSSPPTPYARSFDFNSFSTNYPTTPLPGLQVDGELNNILTSIGTLISRLAEIQRADGALANLSVGPDQITPELMTLLGDLVPRGTWATATAYAFKDLVTRNGATYIALEAHTSDDFETDLAAELWMTLAESASPAETIRGNNTVSSGPTLNLTPAQIAAMLPALAGDSGAGGTKGLAPAPAAGDAAANKYLSASGAWAVIQAATDAASGILALSSVAEVRTGTNATKAVTPAGVATLWRKGADIASDGTLAKPSAANLGGYHVVTGTAAIAAIWADEPEGTEIELEFADALTLTHSTNLILPGAIDVSTVAGDVARFRAMGGSIWRCVSCPPDWYGAAAVAATGDPLFRYFYFGS